MNHNDKNLVPVRGQTEVQGEIRSLWFVVHYTSPSIVRWKATQASGALAKKKKIEKLFSGFKAIEVGLSPSVKNEVQTLLTETNCLDKSLYCLRTKGVVRHK